MAFWFDDCGVHPNGPGEGVEIEERPAASVGTE